MFNTPISSRKRSRTSIGTPATPAIYKLNTPTPIKRANVEIDKSSSSNSSGEKHVSVVRNILLEKEPNTKLRINIFKQPQPQSEPVFSYHKDFIKKEITLPDNPTEIDMAYFTMVKCEIDICLKIEKLRKLNKTNTILLCGIIKTYEESSYTDKNCMLKQVYGGEYTLNKYLTELHESDLSKEHKFMIIMFLYLQCLFLLEGLHQFKLVHNDIHLDNILLKCKFKPDQHQHLKIMDSIKSVIDAIKQNYNTPNYNLVNMIKMITKYSPFQLSIIDFDRTVDGEWDEKQNELFRDNLYHIMGDKSYDLSTQRFLPENDIITLTSRFGAYNHKFKELTYLNGLGTKNKHAFKKWGDPSVIRLLRKELSTGGVITIDSAIKRTLLEI